MGQTQGTTSLITVMASPATSTSSNLSFSENSPVELKSGQLSCDDLCDNVYKQLQDHRGEFLLHLCDPSLNEQAYLQTVSRYQAACKRLKAVIMLQDEHTKRQGPNVFYDAWYLIRQIPESVETILEVRVAVIGNVDAGKSTMLGVLTSGRLDDGRGRARVGLFRHRHEIESGRTSSIGQEILAFDHCGSVITNPEGRRGGWDQICPDAHKVISFMDLAGHERYLKTTMFGLTGGAPDYAILMVGANAGLVGMAKEHLALAFALSTPVLVVITKTDMAPSNILETTVRQLQKILKSPATRRSPMIIRSVEDMLIAASNFVSQRLCPIFQVSNVTGEGVDLLKMFLHLLAPKCSSMEASLSEFQITETYSVPGVGTVVAGTMISGSIGLGHTVFLGPDSLGTFLPCQIKGVQRKRVNVPCVHAGQCASFALKKVKRTQLRKGMVLVSKQLALQPSPEARVCREFEAEVVILFHSTTIGKRYQAMLHCGVIRQTVSIVGMRQDVLRTGDRALVRFRFMHYPEFMKVGARLLFREGRTKGVGKITSLFEMAH